MHPLTPCPPVPQDLMTQNGISYVLNASNSCPKPDFICESRFMRIPINDNYCEKLLPWLDKSIEFIGEGRPAPAHPSLPGAELEEWQAGRLFPGRPAGWRGEGVVPCLGVAKGCVTPALTWSPWPPPARQSQAVQLPSHRALSRRHLPLSHHRHRLHHEDHGHVL